jgi:cellulose synthase operon protein C
MTKPARSPVHALAPAKLADCGAEAMRLGRFKEAIEAFKQLIRQDPQPCWRERLADAYAGRARALADKGMFKEAAVVLENTQAPDGTVRDPVLYLVCLIRQGQHKKAAWLALKYAERERQAAGAGPVAEIAAALSLITPSLMQQATTNDCEWLTLTRAAHAALGAWIQGKSACEVDSLLTHVPLHSPFGPLRLILKCLAMPRDISNKVASLLRRIPPESAFGGWRTAVEAALTDDASALLEHWGGLSPEQQAFVADVRGLPDGAAERLGQVLAAERLGPAALVNLLIKPGLQVPTDVLRAACLDLLPLIPDMTRQFERRFGPLSGLERNRVLALSAEANERWRDAKRHWDAVVASLSGPPGSEARLAQGVVLRHLADLARRHPEVEVESEIEGVAHYLERSLEADPDHLPATLDLIDCCREADNARAWHHLAERAAKRFPESTAVLLHAVDAAVARNAYKKAAGFARQLLQVDPINQAVRVRMIELQLAYARKQMRASRADLAAKALSQASEWEGADAPNPALRIGQALVSYHDQNPAAEARLRQAVALAGGGTIGWFRAVLEAALMGWTDQRRQLLHRELARAQTVDPSRDEILSLMAVLEQREIRERYRVVGSLLWRIDQWLERGASLPWLETEFRMVAARLHDLDAFDALSTYAREATRRNPEEKAAGFYRIVAQTKGDCERLSGRQENALFELLDEAEARHDRLLASRIRSFLDAGIAAGAGAMADLADETAPIDMARLLNQAAARVPVLPEKDVRIMINEFGRDRTIELLADVMLDSPLGDILTEQQIALLCGTLVARAVEGGRPATTR